MAANVENVPSSAIVIERPYTLYLPAEIVANIFQLLPAKSLVAAGLVCSRWSELAEKELTRRTAFVSRMFKDSQKLRLNGTMENMEKQVYKFLNELSVVPAAVIIASFPKLSKQNREKLKKFCVKVALALPKKCAIIVGFHEINAKSLMGENSCGLPEEVENDGILKVSLLVFPKAKDINITKVYVDTEVLGTKKEYWREKLCQDKKFVFLLAGGGPAYIVAHHIYKSLDKNVVLCGGFLEMVFAVNDNSMKSYPVCALAVGGNVDVYSRVVIDYHGKDQNSWIFCSWLREMQLPIDHKLHSSVCFLIKCIHFSTEMSLESSRDFRREFPRMKVFGFSSSGEICSHGLKDSLEKPGINSIFPYMHCVVICVLRYRQ